MLCVRSALLGMALLVSCAPACRRAEPDALPHVRLGMAPKDVRDRFEPGGQGSWTTSVGGTADDTALEWKAGGPEATVETARFEFHLGMLVAIRALTREAAPATEKIAVTPTTVTVRRPAASNAGKGTEVAVLARDCPTHKDEATALADRARN